MLSKLTHLLICLALVTTPAAAGWLPLSEPSATPVSNACSTSSGTSITFTAQGVGGANPNRISAVSINWDDSTNAGTASITAVTLGGAPMIKAMLALSGAQNSNSEIWYVSNPSGTTANIVITAATAINGVTIEVYSLVGFITGPIATTTGTTSASQGYNNKQLALAAGSRQVNVSTSLSNMTNDFSSACGANLWGVHASQLLRGNSQTLTTTISPTSNTPLIALAVWSTTPSPFATFDGVAVNTALSNANLTALHSNNTTGGARTASIKITGKYYYEVTTNSLNGVNSGLEILKSSASYTSGNTFINETIVIVGAGTPGVVIIDGSFTSGSIGAMTGLTTIGVAVDLTNNKVWFRKTPAGDWNGDPTGNPATNTGGATLTGAVSGGLGVTPTCTFVGDNTETCTANFGASAFSGAVPSGFTAGWPR